MLSAKTFNLRTTGVRTGILALLIVLATASEAAGAENKSADLTDISLENLSKISVTTATKREQFLTDTPAAVYVITSEDIAHSGMRTIPDLLRLAPGVDVAQLDSNKWAISIRGFNGRFANKLLVMIDGRSVYTQDFSGVYWDSQDLLLEDIDRIEIVRGPAAALWGANAVNGVINIITKNAARTQGGLVTVGGGSYDKAAAAARYGGTLGSDGYYRVYGKWFTSGNKDTDPLGNPSNTKWSLGSGGVRVDKQLTKRDTLMVTATGYDGLAGSIGEQVVLLPPYLVTGLSGSTRYWGANSLARLDHVASTGTKSILQLYYDHTDRADPFTMAEVRDTVDLDFQQNLRKLGRHGITWGLGYRYTTDSTHATQSLSISLVPAVGSDHLVSGFLQDEIALFQDRARLTLGTRVEHNGYTGFEVEPNLRLLVDISKKQTWWAAVSRAVRTPSRGEREIQIGVAALPLQNPPPPLPNGTPMLMWMQGNPNFGTESVMAYETGYRIKPHRRLSVDIAAFYNRYSDLAGVQLLAPSLATIPQPTHMLLQSQFVNGVGATTYGLESSFSWEPSKAWKLTWSHAYLKAKVVPQAGVLENIQETTQSPTHQLQFHSSYALPHGFGFDSWLKYVTALPGGSNLLPLQNVLAGMGIPASALAGAGATGGYSPLSFFSQPYVQSHVRSDLRMGWDVRTNMKLEVVGQDLFSPRHAESNETDGLIFSGTSRPSRNVFGKFAWRF